MQNGICPRCNSATVYKGALSAYRSQLRIIVSTPGFFGDSEHFEVQCYLCAQCGHIELCAATTCEIGETLQQWLAQADSQHWARVAPPEANA